MSNFKLKKDARHFFGEDMAILVRPMSFWELQKVHPNLLEPVEKVWVESGINKGSHTSIRGWKNANGESTAHFEFTIHARISSDVYKEIKTQFLLDEIQSIVTAHILDIESKQAQY